MSAENMAVNIDELQVETEKPAAPEGNAPAGGAPQAKPDIRAEMERIRERELRLRAD